MALDRFGFVKKSAAKIESESKEAAILAAQSNMHHLKCTKTGCKFERTLRKKKLDASDLICPKCQSALKEKVIRQKKDKNENNDDLGDLTED
jgi:NAD-dependent SIR2 family protein deacetylase